MAEGLVDHDTKAHAQHMCELVANRQMETAAKLAKNGEYICRLCGRVAAKPENICEPVKL